MLTELVKTQPLTTTFNSNRPLPEAFAMPRALPLLLLVVSVFPALCTDEREHKCPVFADASDLDTDDGHLSDHWLLLPLGCEPLMRLVPDLEQMLWPRKVAAIDGMLQSELELTSAHAGACAAAACIDKGTPVRMLRAAVRRWDGTTADGATLDGSASATLGALREWSSSVCEQVGQLPTGSPTKLTVRNGGESPLHLHWIERGEGGGQILREPAVSVAPPFGLAATNTRIGHAFALRSEGGTHRDPHPTLTPTPHPPTPQPSPIDPEPLPCPPHTAPPYTPALPPRPTASPDLPALPHRPTSPPLPPRPYPPAPTPPPPTTPPSPPPPNT